jgi:hypothetical protein
VYEITAASVDIFSSMFSSNSPQRPSKKVTAQIDGVTYEGFVIKVEGKKVLIDDKLQSSLPASSSEEAAEVLLSPARLTIKGVVEKNCIIRSDVDIEARDIGIGCTIESLQGKVAVDNIGEQTRITARNTITAKNAEKVTLISSMGTIEAGDNIEIETIGKECTITCKMGGVEVGNIGAHSTIVSRDNVRAQNVDMYSNIKISMGGVKAKTLAGYVVINARDSIELGRTGNNCKLTSSMGEIEIEELVDTFSELTARDEIIAGASGDSATFISSRGKVKIKEKSGNKVTIKARDGVRVKDIGDDANIHSSMGEVSIRNIGMRGIVNARDGIDFDGTCVNPNSLNLTSSMGRIRRPQQAKAVPAPASSFSDAGRDSSSVVSLGMFSSSEGTIVSQRVSTSQAPTI